MFACVYCSQVYRQTIILQFWDIGWQERVMIRFDGFQLGNQFLLS